MRVLNLILIISLILLSSVFADENDQKPLIVKSDKNTDQVVDEGDKDKDKDKNKNKEDGSAENEQDYNLKLRTLEEKINSLKDKIFRSKQRLAILQETVLSGTIAGSRATVIHKNEVGKAFKLVSAIYYLDEAPVYRKIDAPDELNKKEIVVFDGSIVPGPHHISVFYVYTGKGYGLFSYMKGYTFKMKAGHSFNVEEGNLVEILISPKDRGGSYKLDNRLFTSFNVVKKIFEEIKTLEKNESKK